MKKIILVFSLFAAQNFCFAQKPTNDKKKTESKSQDSTKSQFADEAKSDLINNLSTISLDDNDLNDAGNQNVSSVLTASRDPFNNAAAFNFSVLRFRIRGYESDLFGTYINGVSMDNLDNGFTPFAQWGGLNDISRNRDVAIGLRPNSFAYGDLGNTTYFDFRAIKQRKQTEVGYQISNRNFTHKVDITHSSGLNKKGWAYSFSASRRYADEAYFTGTDYDSWSYYLGIDKKLGTKHTLSLVAFAAPTSVGRQFAANKEVFDLMGAEYNPAWGYQNGKKRNSRVTRTNQPVAIFTHDWRITNSTSLVTAISASTGDRGTSRFDWYNGFNPNPLYYRNLPSYYDDTTLRNAVTQDWKTNPNVSQVNWHKMYQGNRANLDSTSGKVGKRSVHILCEDVVNTTKFNFNTVLNSRLNDYTEFTWGASFQSQANKNYRKVLDLLGGDYYVDRNQFAERFNPANANTIGQSNLLTPDRLVKEGDDYNYNYNVDIRRIASWGQVNMKFENIDFFTSLELSRTNFSRTGNYKNGLFPTISLGKSKEFEFNNFAVKSGMTYKINGRNYIYGNVSIMTRAPFFDNVFISPRIRNSTQENVTNEKINSLEAGYQLITPNFKLRLTGYYTEFKNQMNVINYFDDVYLAIVNYGITNINKAHSGVELGIDAKVIRNLYLNGAVSYGRFAYTSTQNAVKTIDNDAREIGRETVYSKGYYVGGTPQQAYNVGLTYRSPNFWNVGLNLNYFDDMFVEINPIRRTENAVQGYSLHDPMRKRILDQTKLAPQMTLDLFANYSLKLPKTWNITKGNSFIAFTLSVSNLLDNRTMINNYYENPRFNLADFDFFPGMYQYAMGRNFSFSVSYRFN